MTVMKRRDRSNYSLKEALHEIAMADAILDGLGADEGRTLWGRIASVKKQRDELLTALEGLQNAVKLLHMDKNSYVPDCEICNQLKANDRLITKAKGES